VWQAGFTTFILYEGLVGFSLCLWRINVRRLSQIECLQICAQKMSRRKIRKILGTESEKVRWNVKYGVLFSDEECGYLKTLSMNMSPKMLKDTLRRVPQDGKYAR